MIVIVTMSVIVTMIVIVTTAGHDPDCELSTPSLLLLKLLFLHVCGRFIVIPPYNNNSHIFAVMIVETILIACMQDASAHCHPSLQQ